MCIQVAKNRTIFLIHFNESVKNGQSTALLDLPKLKCWCRMWNSKSRNDWRLHPSAAAAQGIKLNEIVKNQKVVINHRVCNIKIKFKKKIMIIKIDEIVTRNASRALWNCNLCGAKFMRLSGDGSIVSFTLVMMLDNHCKSLLLQTFLGSLRFFDRSLAVRGWA